MSNNKQNALLKMNEFNSHQKVIGRLSQANLDNDDTIGLGLYVSKQIVLKYKGDLDFITEKGTGTTFIFTFEAKEHEPTISNTSSHMI